MIGTYLTVTGIILVAAALLSTVQGQVTARRRKNRMPVEFTVTYDDGSEEKITAVDIRWEGQIIGFENEAGFYSRLLTVPRVVEVSSE